MAEVGCKKDIAVNFLEVDKYSLFRGDIEVQGGTVFNKPIHINSTVSHFGHAKGDIYSEPIAVGPAFVGVAGGNASTAVFDKFNASLPANAVISGLFLSVNEGDLNASDSVGGVAITGSVKLKLGDTSDDDRFLKEGLFLNSSLSKLEAGRSYSIIKDNLVTDDDKLKHDVWVNASNYFKQGDNLNPDGSTSVNVCQLQNGALPSAPILTLNCSEAAGSDALFNNNCSLQVFIRYESPFTHNDMFAD